MEIKLVENKEYLIKNLGVGDLFSSKYSNSIFMKMEPPPNTFTHSSFICIASPSGDKHVGKVYQYLNETSVIPLAQKNVLEVTRK